MPRIATLYPVHQPSSGTSQHRHRRNGHNSYLHPATKPYSKRTPEFRHRPRTLAHEKHPSSKPSIFSRSSANFWKSKFSFRSRTTQAPPQPLTLEEKLRVAADRVRRFDRQTKPQVRPQTRAHTRRHPRIHAETLSKTKAPVRKRDKLQARLNTFTSGKF